MVEFLALSDSDCLALMGGHRPPPPDAPAEVRVAYWDVFFIRARALYGDEAAELVRDLGTFPSDWLASFLDQPAGIPTDDDEDV